MFDNFKKLFLFSYFWCQTSSASPRARIRSRFYKIFGSSFILCQNRIFTTVTYCMFKKYCPFLYRELPIKIYNVQIVYEWYILIVHGSCPISVVQTPNVKMDKTSWTHSLLYGSSHMWTEKRNLICLRHFFTSTVASNSKIFFLKIRNTELSKIRVTSLPEYRDIWRVLGAGARTSGRSGGSTARTSAWSTARYYRI